MKPSFSYLRPVTVLASALLLVACGQRGPLYMPGKPAADPAASSAPATPAAGAVKNNTAPASTSSSK